LAFIRGVEFAAIDPDGGLLMAPALALPRLLARHGLSAAGIGLFEIHEAFAAQVAANVQIWERGWSKYPDIRSIGLVDWEKINVNGGSLAIGHPFAATGARLLMSLAAELGRRELRYGVATACAAGGAGCAMLLERFAV
jgi:acetyl-CoA acetyltransferase